MKEMNIVKTFDFANQIITVPSKRIVPSLGSTRKFAVLFFAKINNFKLKNKN